MTGIDSDQALHDVQQSAEAVFDDSAAVAPRAVHFGNPRVEYEAATSAAALFDLSDRPQIEVTGGDRVKFLHNFCTNDIKKLQAGEGCEAFVTNVKGRILAHIFVFATDEALWIETAAGAEPALLAHLDRYLITEDVELHGRTAELGELFVSGKQASQLLNNNGIDVAELGLYGHASAKSAGISVVVRRVDLLGTPGYLLSIAKAQLAPLWKELYEAGAQPAGSAAFHALRIETGMPLYSVDLSEDNLAQEAARNSQAISFTKGCYLGQEPIARIDALGHVNRELRGLKLSSAKPPEPGAPVLAGDDSQEIGHVTSSALSYSDDRPVALALLRSNWTAPGTEVTVKCGDEAVRATVFWPAR